jgi:DNA-binding transcriptional regulator YiaG
MIMTIKALIAASGMTQQAFADHLSIPKRTIESWVTTSEANRRKCPDYVISLIAYRLRAEGIIPDTAE